jgi:hypothetical protein
LKIDPNDSSSWYNLNICLRQLDRMDEAILLSRRRIAHTVLKERCTLHSLENVTGGGHSIGERNVYYISYVIYLYDMRCISDIVFISKILHTLPIYFIVISRRRFFR